MAVSFQLVLKLVADHRLLLLLLLLRKVGGRNVGGLVEKLVSLLGDLLLDLQVNQRGAVCLVHLLLGLPLVQVNRDFGGVSHSDFLIEDKLEELLYGLQLGAVLHQLDIAEKGQQSLDCQLDEVFRLLIANLIEFELI